MSTRPPTHEGVPGAARLAWETELDRLELELHRAERLLTAARTLEAPDWQAPPERGPMPDYLLPRARQIHARQQELIERLARSLEITVRRQALSGGEAHSMTPPLYIDLVG